VYNAVAPQPASNKKLIRTMAAEQKIAVPVPVPEFALRLILGEMSIEVLKSATVSSKKIEESGYVFMFPGVEVAVKNLK
jgi:NAD dependent epimerase/dehydratase family enzyme